MPSTAVVNFCAPLLSKNPQVLALGYKPVITRQRSGAEGGGVKFGGTNSQRFRVQGEKTWRELQELC